MNPVLTKDMTEFNHLYKETDNIYARYAASQGISTTTMCVLYSLYTGDTLCSQNQLVEDWGFPLQTVNSCLKSMEKKGIIRLEFAAGSRKSKCILLTASGEEMCRGIIAPLVEAENHAFDKLGEKERQLLLKITKTYNQLLQNQLFPQI